MIYFRSDYSQGAHPKVLEALMQTNLEHTDGYGLDRHCEHAAEMVKELIGLEDCDVYMMVGGTPCNVTTLAASLRPYESVVAPRTGHAYFHETGAVEGTGHRIVAMNGINGKLTPELIDRAWDEYEDEHTPVPKLVYVSQPTEGGSIYSKAEMTAIAEKCKERDMLLYVDGARLATAITAKQNDLSLKDLAQLCDAFYLGGTKNGALFGEALVIKNKTINDHFRHMIKRQCGLLAKGRLIGVQFEALLEGGMDSIYFEMAAHENRLAEKLREGLGALNVQFYSDSQTNQVFPVLPTAVVEELEKDFFFYRWAPEKDGMTPIRLVTAWGTQEADVDAILEAVARLLK
ncbi:MAG: threonine aldolase [Oscillospiraceae bacterium]|nr:threonine aldolase [Oscillospiraceae bacterium]